MKASASSFLKDQWQEMVEIAVESDSDSDVMEVSPPVVTAKVATAAAVEPTAPQRKDLDCMTQEYYDG